MFNKGLLVDGTMSYQGGSDAESKDSESSGSSSDMGTGSIIEQDENNKQALSSENNPPFGSTTNTPLNHCLNTNSGLLMSSTASNQQQYGMANESRRSSLDVLLGGMLDQQQQQGNLLGASAAGIIQQQMSSLSANAEQSNTNTVANQNSSGISPWQFQHAAGMNQMMGGSAMLGQQLSASSPYGTTVSSTMNNNSISNDPFSPSMGMGCGTAQVPAQSSMMQMMMMNNTSQMAQISAFRGGNSSGTSNSLMNFGSPSSTSQHQPPTNAPHPGEVQQLHNQNRKMEQYLHEQKQQLKMMQQEFLQCQPQQLGARDSQESGNARASASAVSAGNGGNYASILMGNGTGGTGGSPGTMSTTDRGVGAYNMLDPISQQQQSATNSLMQQHFAASALPYANASAAASFSTGRRGSGIVAAMMPPSALDNSRAAIPRKGEMIHHSQQETFPMKLHRLLADLEQQEDGVKIATFLADGQAFIIKDTFRFEQQTMPTYFPRMKQFASFQRQLNLYDFKRINGSGSDKGAYRHELFVRAFPELSRAMKRTKIKGVFDKKKAKEAQQPKSSMFPTNPNHYGEF